MINVTNLLTSDLEIVQNLKYFIILHHNISYSILNTPWFLSGSQTLNDPSHIVLNLWLLNSYLLIFIRFNSAVKYASDRHFRDQVYCAQVQTATSFSETVVAVQNCTWRSYKSEVHFEPRHRPLHFQSTAIVFPKHARNTYRTTLNYNSNRNAAGRRWFVSTVRLESTEDASPCIIYTEDLWETHKMFVIVPKIKKKQTIPLVRELQWKYVDSVTKILIQNGWQETKERKWKVSEGHFVVLLLVTLVLDSGDEVELCVCVCSLYMCRMSVMYLCTSFLTDQYPIVPVRWREKHLGQNSFCCLLIH